MVRILGRTSQVHPNSEYEYNQKFPQPKNKFYLPGGIIIELSGGGQPSAEMDRYDSIIHFPNLFLIFLNRSGDIFPIFPISTSFSTTASLLVLIILSVLSPESL